MTTLIGITKAPDEAERFCRMEFKGLGTRVIAGPFGSADKAGNWAKFIQSRFGEYRNVSVPVTASKDGGWYGFAFELTESET